MALYLCILDRGGRDRIIQGLLHVDFCICGYSPEKPAGSALFELYIFCLQYMQKKLISKSAK